MRFFLLILMFVAGGVLGYFFNDENGRYAVMGEKLIIDTKNGVIYKYYNSRIIMVDMVEGKRVEYEVKRYKK